LIKLEMTPIFGSQHIANHPALFTPTRESAGFVKHPIHDVPALRGLAHLLICATFCDWGGRTGRGKQSASIG
jgi:hypothetical protein